MWIFFIQALAVLEHALRASKSQIGADYAMLVDISNHGAVMRLVINIHIRLSRFVNLVDGRPDKSGYRKFMIKTVSGPDDYAMIAEIVHRRYSRLVREDKPMPDLVLIDGGRGQLGAACKKLKQLGLKLQCASLAKEYEHVFVPARVSPIIMPHNNKALKILQYARDEAHRFGVSYNRNVLKRRTLGK